MEIVSLLIERGVDVNARYPNELTALMWAAGSGHAKAVAVLLDKGADTALLDNRGKTALQPDLRASEPMRYMFRLSNHGNGSLQAILRHPIGVR